MAGRIRTHLRSNVVAYLALFVALGGSAYAAAEIGSKDIRRNAVLSKHLKKNAVASKDIRNRKGVTSRDVKKSTLRSSDVKNRGLRARDVRGLEDLIAQVAALNQQLNGPDGLARQIELIRGVIGDGNGGDGSVELPNLNSFDERLDALCAQAGAVNQEFNELLGADLDPVGGLLNGTLDSLSGIDPVDFDPAVCQG